MKFSTKKLLIAAAALIFIITSCNTQHKTVEIAGQKVPIKIYSDRQIQADAWVLTYMTCETDMLKYKYSHDSTNNKLKYDIKKSDRERKMFFNKMFVRYFRDSTYKRKFLSYQKEGEKLFRPCQQINAIKKMNKGKK